MPTTAGRLPVNKQVTSTFTYDNTLYPSPSSLLQLECELVVWFQARLPRSQALPSFLSLVCMGEAWEMGQAPK